MKKSNYSNIPQFVENKLNSNLHNKVGHPIKIVKEYIYDYFNKSDIKFEIFDNLSQVVTVENNFDRLLIPKEHPSRSKSDTYYVDETTVLRTHTSAHQNELLAKNHSSFLVTGDVYRKDEVDNKHFYCFHQMEGVHLVPDDIDPKEDLKKVLSGLVKYLFPDKEYKFGNDYFPFTDPSFEIEVNFGDKWLEILGCGVIHHKILDHHNISKKGWAFGLGLERIAMILFDIPDIRLFWSNDSRFLDQFKEEKIITFKPYPKLMPLSKDVSFWIKYEEVSGNQKDFKWNNINDFYEIVRAVCGESVESVNVLDKFYHSKKNKYSITFRLLIGAKNVTDEDHALITQHANECIINIIVELKKNGYEIR